MLQGNIKSLFKHLSSQVQNLKLSKRSEIYDPVTGNTVVTSDNFNIKCIEVSINTSNESLNNKSTDRQFYVRTDTEVDISDTIIDSYIDHDIIHIKKIVVNPLIYEVVIRVH
jgi:hypothetical protein